MTVARKRFSNAVRILYEIDFDEFTRATGLGGFRWERFRDDPVRTFLQLDEPKADALWRLVEAQQPAELRTPATILAESAPDANQVADRARLIEALAEAKEALKPLADFLPTVEEFVLSRAAAATDAPHIMAPTKRFRLTDFIRAVAARDAIDAAIARVSP